MMYDLKNWLRGFATRKQALILTYHSIQKRSLPFTVWSHLSEERFELQIAYLAKHFRCVSLSTLLNEMADGRIQPYTVAITFDDGFLDNVTTAFPILQRYRIPATIFLTTNFVGNSQLLWPEQVSCALTITKKPFLDFAGTRHTIETNDQKSKTYRQLAHVFKNMPPADIPQQLNEMLNQAEVTIEQINSSAWYGHLRAMDWNDAKMLRESGLVEFGAHTITHGCLSALTNADAEHEIRESKHIIESHLGPIDYFAYPYGEGYYTDEHRSMCMRAGYKAVLTTLTQKSISPRTDCYALPRAGIGADTNMETFTYMLHGGVTRADTTAK